MRLMVLWSVERRVVRIAVVFHVTEHIRVN